MIPIKRVDCGPIAAGSPAAPGSTRLRRNKPTSITFELTSRTPIRGLLRTTTNNSTPLTMFVERIGARHVGRFDFTGTPVAVDPKNFVVDTHTIDLKGMTGDNTPPFANADPIGVRGVFTPAGTTGVPSANFDANSVIDRGGIAALLLTHWTLPGTAAPFSGAKAFPLMLDLTNANIAAVIRADSISALTGTPSVALSNAPIGPFVLRRGLSVTVYEGDEAQAWLDDVNKSLQTEQAVRFMAVGKFSSNSLTAQSAELQLK